ncbi:nitroreductase family protein [Brachybacterium sp. DNPG3]
MTAVDTAARSTAARNATSTPIAPLLAERWSPRGFAVDHELDDAELTSLVEAARWSPSWMNSQPWRLAVARRGTALFDRIVETLAGFNQAWMPRTSALVVLVTENEREGDALPYAAYDAGQAAAHLSIQAVHLGLWAHQVAGFDKAAISELFDLDASQEPLTIIGIGRHSEQEDVPEGIRTRDAAPRVRRGIDEILLAPIA